MSGGFQTDGVILDPHDTDPDCDGQLRYIDSEPHIKARVGGRVVRVTERLITKFLNMRRRVPSGGGALRAFDLGEIPTTSVPYIVQKEWTVLRRLSLRVNQADATNDYSVDVYRRNTTSIIHSMVLSSTNTQVSEDLSVDLSALDELEFRLRRVSGTGRSDFRNAVLEVIFGE